MDTSTNRILWHTPKESITKLQFLSIQFVSRCYFKGVQVLIIGRHMLITLFRHLLVGKHGKINSTLVLNCARKLEYMMYPHYVSLVSSKRVGS